MITFGECKKQCGNSFIVDEINGKIIFKDTIIKGLVIEFFFSGYGDEAELHVAVGNLPFPSYEERYLKSKLGRYASADVYDIENMWKNNIYNRYNCSFSMRFNDEQIVGPGINVYWNKEFSSGRMPERWLDLFASIQDALTKGHLTPGRYIRRENL